MSKLEAEVQRILQERETAAPLSPMDAELARLMQTTPVAEPEGPSIGEQISAGASGLSQVEGVAVTTAGALQSGLLDPLAGLFGLPGAFVDQQIFTDQISDFFERASKGLYSTAERAALQAGLSHEEIAAAHGLGKFVGFVAPTTASIKIGGFLLGRAPKIASHITSGSLITDFAAGAVFGGVFLEGDTPGERAQHLAEQSALFGVGRIILGGIIAPFKAYKFLRANRMTESQKLNEILTRLERGEKVTIEDEQTARSVMALLSEEEFIASSPAAQDILARSGSRAAIVQGIRDVAEAKGSMGVIRSFGNDLVDVEDQIAGFRSQFPALKFEALKREGEFDVFFGTRGLSNKQRAQFKNEGRFEGQKIWKDGSEYEYIGKASRSEYLKVRRADDSIVEIKNKNITDLPYAREPVGPELDALYQDFSQWVQRHAREVSGLREGMSEFDIIAGLRSGAIHLDETARRAFDEAGAIIHPDELGLPGASAGEVLERILNEGTENAWLLEAPEAVTFEDLFDLWAKQTGIIEESADYISGRVHFADRLRRDLWQQVPEEDRAIFDAIRKELFDRIEADELPLEAIAHMKGFNLDRLENGLIRMRDINTGAEFRFGSERIASEALKNIVRKEKEIGGWIPPGGGGGMPPLTGGFGHSDGEWFFDGRVQASEFLENIPFSAIRNVRDYLIDIEQRIGTQLFTRGFDLIDTGTSRMRNRYEPFAREIEKAWRGLKPKQKQEVVEFWIDVEGSELTLTQAVKRAQEQGLSSRQIDAFRRSRALFDQWFPMAGLSESRYIPLYYTRLRPWAEANGGVVDIRKIFEKEGVPPEFEFWAEMSRTGELSILELDPETVMHKYIRGLLFKQEVKPHWDRVAQLVGAGGKPPLRIGDLPEDIRAKVIKNAHPSGSVEELLAEPVLPKPVRDVLEEYLTNIRGHPGAGFGTLRRFAQKFFRMMGIKGDPRVMEQYWNDGMSTMYGAAMGLRQVQVSRNFVQNFWTLYTRNGNKHASSSLATAMTPEGWNEAVEAGAIRLSEAGLPYSDVIFENIVERGPRGTGGPVSMVIAAAMRAGLRLGYLSRKTAEKFLIPFSSMDHMNRGWAYHWQKQFTGDILDRFEAGRIGWEKFVDDGLPFFSNTIKDEFAQLYRSFGRDDALRYIGKMASDEANFIYGVGAQPAWMQRPFGRLLGMFGTWPLWSTELYFRRMKYGTLKQKMMFTARTMALTGAFANLTMQTGINFWNWIAPLSFNWAGGPMADYLIAAKRVMDAPVDQKADALGTLVSEMGRLAFPGQVFLADMRAADFLPGGSSGPRDPWEGALIMMLGRPTDEDHFSMKWLFNEDLGQDTVFKNPMNMRFLQPIEIPQTETLRIEAPRSPAPDLDMLIGNMPNE